MNGLELTPMMISHCRLSALTAPHFQLVASLTDSCSVQWEHYQGSILLPEAKQSL